MRVVPWLTSRLAAVGRMAFTNYLLNSAVVVFLFHKVGLDLIDAIGPFGGLIVALGLFYYRQRRYAEALAEYSIAEELRKGGRPMSASYRIAPRA